jgi:predicted nucleotidyltransferase
MFELPPSLKSRLRAPGILGAAELVELLEATVKAYHRDVPRVRSVILFGGIPLGEFHPRFSDVDLAVVFGGEAPKLASRLPEAVCAAIETIRFVPESRVRAKHVGSAVMEAMQDQDWQAWASWSAENPVTESSYPFTLCDTWLVHNCSLTLSGPSGKDRFPFADAPPVHRDVELARLKRFANRLALAKPFGGLCGLDLAGEFIYYGTDLTRDNYTLRIGVVIGRVASTKWYRRLFGGPAGAYARLLGEFRRSPAGSDLSRVSDHAALWMLFLHYAREVLRFAFPSAPVPERLPGQDEFGPWLESWIVGQSTGR